MNPWVILLASILTAASAPRNTPPEEHEQRQAFTLRQALDAMERGHAWLEAGRELSNAARARARQARQWSNPEVTFDYVLGVRESTYDRGGSWLGAVGQFLELSGTPHWRGRVGDHEAEASEAELSATRLQLSAAIEAAMVDLAAALHEVSIRRDMLASLERAAAIVESRRQSGVVPAYDATRLSLARDQTSAALQRAEAAAIAARGELNVVVGPFASELVGLPDVDIFKPSHVEDLESAQARMLEQRPDLAALRAQAQAAQARVQVARREVFPGLALRAVVGFGQGPDQLDVGFGVAIPLPVVKRGQAAIPAAKAEERAAHALTRAAQAAAMQRLAASYAEAQRLRDAALDLHQRIEQGDLAVTQAESAYRDARIAVQGLLDAYTAAQEQRLLVLQLSRDARWAEIRVRQLAGMYNGVN